MRLIILYSEDRIVKLQEAVILSLAMLGIIKLKLGKNLINLMTINKKTKHLLQLQLLKKKNVIQHQDSMLIMITKKFTKVKNQQVIRVKI